MRFLLALFLVGCASAEPAQPLPPFFDPHTVVTLDVTGQPDWVQESAALASAFWATHGLSFEVVANGELPVLDRETPPGTLGVYWPQLRQVWLLDLGVHEPGFQCTLAHELGHSVGLMHVSRGGSLMSEIAGINADGTCLWTQLDQAEVERVLGGVQ